MFVLVLLVTGLGFTQTVDLSSQLEEWSEGNYGDFSFVQNKAKYAAGKVVDQSSESTDVNDNISERAFKELTNNPQQITVECTNTTMKVILPAGPLKGIRILGSSATESVSEAPKSCGYMLTKTPHYNTLIVSFTGCHVRMEGGQYSIRLLYVTDDGRVNVNPVSCPAHQYVNLTRPQSDDPKVPTSKCGTTSVAPKTTTLTPVLMPRGCSISQEKQIDCGAGISASECLAKGCCVGSTTAKCYYPINECTMDKHFVFVITNDFGNMPVSTTSLVIAGDPNCKPVVANSNFALFKFSVTECGTRVYEIGENLVYLAEVQTALRALKLKYGIITRDNPIRVMVECRYPKYPMPVQKTKTILHLASAGFLVMSPSLPATVTSEGLYGIQLRIAKDNTFSSFLPHYHQPLRLLLGRPVYLEARIVAPRPFAVLVVHYCVAYTRSASSALVLIYEGCPNALDSGSTSILYVSGLPQTRHTRRFVVKAFQFMDQTTNKFLNEEIYFMCSAEVCLSSEITCKETCFDKKVSP